MGHKDRSHYRVRKFQPGDPEQDTDVELREMTPSQRIAMVFQINEVAWSIHDSQKAGKPHDRRLARQTWHVEKIQR